MPIAEVTIGLETITEVPSPEIPRWRLVFSKDYPEARTYRGKCTHEDVAFLIDPVKLLFEDWQKWAQEELPKQIEQQYTEKGVTPLRLKIYVGTEPVLWGLAEYPAVRVESWHHGSPGIVLVLALIIGVVIVVWAFLAWLFQKAEEVDWTPVAVPIGIGAIALLLIGLAALKPKREEEVI